MHLTWTDFTKCSVGENANGDFYFVFRDRSYPFDEWVGYAKVVGVSLLGWPSRDAAKVAAEAREEERLQGLTP